MIALLTLMALAAGPVSHDSPLTEVKQRAEAGEAPAQYELGFRSIANGDDAQFLAWEAKAAAQRFEPAYTILSSYYRARNDTPAAVRWLRKGADQGLAACQYELADILRRGDEGVEMDLPTAVTWYRKAAAQGHIDAKGQLARCLLFEDGVERNPAEAFKNAKEAVAAGAKWAFPSLGHCYELGLGVPASWEEACYCYTVADGPEDERAVKAAAHLPPARLAEVRRRAAEWHAAHPDD